MIIETVTLTAEPKSIYTLVGEVRTFTGPERVKGITVRNLSDVEVYASEKNTVEPVIICDPADDQKFEAHIDSNVHQTLLSGAGAIVGLIVSQ